MFRLRLVSVVYTVKYEVLFLADALILFLTDSYMLLKNPLELLKLTVRFYTRQHSKENKCEFSDIKL